MCLKLIMILKTIVYKMYDIKITEFKTHLNINYKIKFQRLAKSNRWMTVFKNLNEGSQPADGYFKAFLI
ncbi:hypothetical protein DYD21_00890 [Rhodohalobacter sp. SW132]|nr:hypothetical protein DYD21_00890 [Rhodohalobacter sp. SW132]